MSESQKFDVVIAGGGFAGIYCAQSLSRELGRESLSRVSLIAEENYMVFQPMLAEVCGSSISPRHVVNPIRLLCRGATVLRGTISSIDLTARQLKLNAGLLTPEVPIGFGHLVFAMGGVVDLSRVPGMPEHALVLKNVGDALKLRAAVIDRIEEANLHPDPAMTDRLLTIVIVGGGFSGVETAGEIHDLLDDIKRFYPRLAQKKFRVLLIHSGTRLLPEISESLGLYCEKNLAARGVEILLNARVSAMTASKVYLQDGRTIDSYTVATTVGNAPHPLLVDFCKTNNLESVNGRLVTDATMRVKNQERLWAAGDCAAVPVDGSTNFCPPTAQFAYRQGQLLGQNIARALDGRTLKPFHFKGLGELAAIGHRSAVAEILGIKFSGFIAWFMWRTIYLLKLPGLERKFRVMIDWTLDLFFPRDITLMAARPTEVVKEVHLEKGDRVFQAGEPARSFYIVKTGRIDLLDENGIVKTLTAGEYFGERALLQDKIWRFNAVAAETSTLVSVDGGLFQTLSRASEPIRHFFEQSASQYLTRKQIETLVGAIPAEIRPLCAEDLMTRDVITMRTEMTFAQGLRLIEQHHHSSFPVVDGAGKVLGLLQQADVCNEAKNVANVNTSRLGEFPPLRCETVEPALDIPAVVERFCRSGAGLLIVADGEGKLRGVLSLADVFAGGVKR